MILTIHPSSFLKARFQILKPMNYMQQNITKRRSIKKVKHRKNFGGKKWTLFCQQKFIPTNYFNDIWILGKFDVFCLKGFVYVVYYDKHPLKIVPVADYYTVMKSWHNSITLHREKQSVLYIIRICLFLFLKDIQFTCLKLIIKLVNIAIMLKN